MILPAIVDGAQLSSGFTVHRLTDLSKSFTCQPDWTARQTHDSAPTKIGCRTHLKAKIEAVFLVKSLVGLPESVVTRITLRKIMDQETEADFDSFKDSSFLIELLQSESQRRKDLIKDEFIEPFDQDLLNEMIYFSKSEDEDYEIEFNQRQNRKLVVAPSKKLKITRKNTSSSKRKGKRPNIKRNHLEGHQLLMQNFFSNNDHDQNPPDFLNQFKMSKRLFLKIVDQVSKHNSHFTQRKDALGTPGHSSMQKVLAATQQLSYGIGPNGMLSEYIRMADSTALECLIRFCKVIVEIYGPTYLRSPNQSDLERLNCVHSQRGLPGMLGTLDFTFWEWQTCPTGWGGRFQAKGRTPTTVLEVVASYDSWIWSAFFSTPGTCKDIDVFAPDPPIYSPHSSTPSIKSTTDGTDSNVTGYYLCNPFYPPIPPLIPLLTNPKSEKEKLFAKRQRAVLRDAQKAIEQLTSRFEIVKRPCRMWSSNAMGEVIKAVVIIHNMIVEDEREDEGNLTETNEYADFDIQVESTNLPPQVASKIHNRFQRFQPSINSNHLTYGPQIQ
ncbi:hypothetical protein O181_030728 [Austropuccinia psidii MF-1]|uniref:DDE Tnp4 domain-containing protein n=1 Tax=Austropuccinia psidii MF-1 TaxID=1389203 RepID=A0A9Q3CW23_9BASI|nr:hypothetical protein [Austropuccinia psidii MF-1]